MRRHFRLSNRQRKELYVRARPLLIALPLSEEDVRDARRDPLSVAHRLLPEVDETIQQADIHDVSVEMSLKERPKPESLKEVFGTILDASRQVSESSIACQLKVLLVWLCHGEMRNAQATWQWPQDVIVDGVGIITGLQVDTRD